jgi:hypothetical protein
MEPQAIRQLLRPFFWDYDLDPYEVFEVVMSERERVGSFTRETALIRLFERLSWYDILQLFGVEHVTALLTKELIRNIRFPELRERYELVRKILHGEPVSFSGWSPEYRQKIQRTLLSHRWYRTQPEGTA